MRSNAVSLGGAKQRTAVSATAVGAALLLLQSTVMWPGTVIAIGESTESPTAEPTPTATPIPAASPEPTASPDATVGPSPEPTPSPLLEATPSPSPLVEPTPSATPEPSPVPGSALSVTNYTFARIPMAGQAVYLTPGSPLTDEPRFEVFRVRFDLANADVVEHSFTPSLEYALPGGDFAALPEEPAAVDVPFRAANEWVAQPEGGTQIGPEITIEPADTATGISALIRSSGVNPLPAQTVPAQSTLSVELSVSATVGADYGATYVLRLTDAGTPLAGASEATLTMGAQPELQLSPGQRSGTAPEPTKDRPGPLYPLAPSSTSIHAPAFDLTSSSCVTCHRTHTAVGSTLNSRPTEYALCASCHNGVDQPAIANAYTGVPANNAAGRAYYQHDPTATEGVPGTTNNCAECHNPHNTTSDPATETAAGWTASGRLTGVAGVDLEYQLCYRCHAAPATLPSNDLQPPSRYALDKAVEFDPANVSFHPIEAAGTNQTPALANSLAASGTSPYKLWSWQTTSTIRCVNCHADARIAEAAFQSGGSVAANADLPVHASTQRGILIQPYQDRLLNGPIEPYQAADFALCYVCHSEAPFVDQTGQVRDGQNGTTQDTNFRYHGVHLSNPAVMRDRGFPGSDIDTPGFGSGFAVCAECHFRIHSSALPADGKVPGPRLVNFAPNVTAPTGGTLGWQARTETTAGSCTLKCHGAPHTAVEY